MDEREGYHVMGRDQRPYGPLTSSTLEDWLIEGKITLGSLAWQVGNLEWSPLSRLIKSALPSPVEQLNTHQRTLLERFSAYAILKGYEVGAPRSGVDNKNTALAVKAAASIAKFALSRLTKQRIYGGGTVSGSSASQGVVYDAATPLIAHTDVLALRNDFVHGAGAFAAILGDSLSLLDMLARLDFLIESCKLLREFALEWNGQRAFSLKVVIFDFGAEAFERHRRIIPLAGNENRRDPSGYVMSQASIVDVSRKLVDYSAPGGVLATLQKVSGLIPFEAKDLYDVIGP
jgi:hypothetical protein